MGKLVLVQDLPELPAVLEQAKGICVAKHVGFDDYLKLFDESLRGKICGSALGDGVTHVVCFENLDMWSSQLGHRTSMVVGTKQAYTLEKLLGTPFARLGDRLRTLKRIGEQSSEGQRTVSRGR